MNKLVTGIKGLMPIYQEDFDFLQQSFSDIAKGLASVFGDNYILSGCEYTENGSGMVSWSAGWVVLNSEVLYFPAQTTNWVNQIKMKIESIETEEREFEFADELGIKNHKIWELRTARAINIEEFDDPDVFTINYDAKQRLETLYADVSSLKNTFPFFQVSLAGVCNIRLNKDLSSRVYGYVKLISQQNISEIFDVPAERVPWGTTILFSNQKGTLKLVKVTESGSVVCRLYVEYDNTNGIENLTIPINYTYAG